MSKLRFPMPSRRRQTGNSTHETPADYATAADALTAASEALRAASEDWRAAQSAQDDRAVMVAKIAGQRAALAAAGALAALSNLPRPKGT